jgi:aspartyl-tRNA(Asn)/glutamyl-tRNA(Gln) amidotransferase subunit A
MSSTDLCFLSAAEAADLVKRRALSPVEIVEAVLERVASLNDALLAFCAVDTNQVRTEAKAIEARVSRGEPVGPLAGVPIGIKDLIFTRGLPTTGGSSLYRDFIPDEDDIVVERLRQADAIILGKTNVPEFGFGPGTVNQIFGVTRNPWDPELSPGGSSGGSAVAVATGMGPAALGSDGGGSIRTPSSLCGVYGLKPSFGRVPLYPGCRDPRFPGFSAWESLEHLGPITRTVGDAALLLDVLAGPDRRDRHSIPRGHESFTLDAHEPDLRGLRIAWTTDVGGYARVDPDVRAVFEAAVNQFAAMGATVDHASPRFEDPGGFFEALVALDSDLAILQHTVAEHPEAVNPRILRMATRDWSFLDGTAALTRRRETYNRAWRFFERYDLLLTPTLPVVAFDLAHGFPPEIDGSPAPPHCLGWFTQPFNLTGTPAASIPCGWTPAGLPVGLQIAGGHLADALVLRASRAFEIAAPWAER